MADNIDVTPGTGKTIAADDIGGVLHQQVKIEYGADNTATPVSSANPLPVVQTGTPALPTGAATDAKLDTIISSIDGLEGSVDGVETLLTTISGNVDGLETSNSAIQTSVQLIDDAIYTDGTGTVTKGMAILGQDGTNPQAIKTDSNGELQVDVLTMPTVAVTQSGTWDEVGINDSGNSITVDNAGTFAVQVDGSALTSLQLIDDPIATLGTTTYTEASTKGNIIGAVRRDANTSLVDTTNEIAPLQVNATGELKVAQIQALPAGTNAIGKLAANDGVDIGDVTINNASGGSAVNIQDGGNSITVDYATTGSGTATGALRVELPTNGTGVIATVGAVTAITNALPAGTNAIGKLAANSGVDIGDVDVTSVIPGTGATNLGKAEDAGHTTGDVGVYNLGVRNDTPNTALTNTDADYTSITTDRVGGIRTALYETDFAVLGTNHVKKYYTNAGAVTDGIVWSPAAGKRWYVTDLIINTSAAATITFEDDKAGGDEVVMKFELAANSGVVHHFGTPLFSGEDAADLLVTTSAGNVYITITGYEI